MEREYITSFRELITLHWRGPWRHTALRHFEQGLRHPTGSPRQPDRHSWSTPGSRSAGGCLDRSCRPARSKFHLCHLGHLPVEKGTLEYDSPVERLTFHDLLQTKIIRNVIYLYRYHRFHWSSPLLLQQMSSLVKRGDNRSPWREWIREDNRSCANSRGPTGKRRDVESGQQRSSKSIRMDYIR